LRTNPEVDKAVKKFTIELFRILFKRQVTATEKIQLLIIHISENKVWACYFAGLVFAIAFSVYSFILKGYL
jgi:hypothetical protein